MASLVHRNSLSAWNALREAGVLDLDDRDADLICKLKERLDPSASDLESALVGATTDQFLRALFATVQPFVSMFRDILVFFENAGAHQGQHQWRVSVGEEFLDLRHFEEFLQRWDSIDVAFDVPVLPRRHAFILNDARIDVGGYGYLIEGLSDWREAKTGLSDVDAWVADYKAGRYAPFPPSLMPKNFPTGLSDVATVILAAVSFLRGQGLTRDQVLQAHRERHCRSVDDDALHLWTIAQSETDYWLHSHVVYLANILQRPKREVQALAEKLVELLAAFPRRRIPDTMDVGDLERLLSLPSWKQRYETYGVWVATRILKAIDDHDVRVHSDDGELRFAFSEAKIADVETADPKLSLIAERRVPLIDPVGKSRKEGAQPDFGLWDDGSQPPECKLIVEVKHYKRRSRRNFREALIDYGRAHPRANVVLVNYGHVGTEFEELSNELGRRCRMIGPLTPEQPQALADFRELVRVAVGDPVHYRPRLHAATAQQLIVLDVSASMQPTLASRELRSFLTRYADEHTKIAMVDQDIRAFVASAHVEQWLKDNPLGSGTSLAAPLVELLSQHERILVVTDESGLRSLKGVNQKRLVGPLDDASAAVVVHVAR